MYKIQIDEQTRQPLHQILRISDGACIPFDPANTDYAEYLKWLEAGNTPLPPDTQPE